MLDKEEIKMSKVYAIAKGKIDNQIVHSWQECEDLVAGVPGARYKSFKSEEEAAEWLGDVFMLKKYSQTAKKESGSRRKRDCFEKIYIYSDGACSGNPGHGGWGAIIKYNGQPFEISGGAEETTNNQMELLGFINALKFAIQNFGKNKPIEVCLDSQYVLKGTKDWMPSWKKNGWKKSDGKPVLNLELWKEIDSLVKGLKINYVWVKGHAGHPENERCDALAVKASHSPEMWKDFEVKNVEKPKVKKEKFTNFDLFQTVDKETLVKILCSNRFSKIILAEGPTKLLDILDKPAQNWNVDTVKQILEERQK